MSSNPWLAGNVHHLVGIDKYEPFLIIREKLLSLDKEILILETGGPHPGYGQWSTQFFMSVLEEVPGSVISIDINPVCAEEVERHNWQDKVVSITGDSLVELAKLDNIKPDLIMLDSFDVDFENDTPSAEHHLKEMELCRRFFSPGMLIAVDDNLSDGRGKGRLISEVAENEGWTQLYGGYLKVWQL